MRSSNSPSPHFSHFCPGRDARLVGFHLVAGFIEVHREAVPEFAHRRAPGKLALFDFVELVFQSRGETNVENILERFHQKIAHFFAQHRGREAALILIHIFALDDRRNDRGIRGRPADSLFFEFLYQRRFRVSRRRLGKVLLGANRFQAQLLAFANHGEPVAGGVAFVFLFFLVLHGLVRGEIAFELHHRSGRAERVAVGIHVNRGLIENRGNHLRRHEALPNHLVELEHIVVEKAPHAFRRASNIGRTNRFVRFLRVFFRLIESSAFLAGSFGRSSIRCGRAPGRLRRRRLSPSPCACR